MKNSRRSDREIAHAVGISQPTVGRIIKKLEKEGVIKEYTMIPDFTRLGYTIMGATLLEIQSPLGKEKLREVRKVTTKMEDSNPHSVLMAVTGLGIHKNRLFISFYEDYSDYAETTKLARQIPFVNIESVDNFLVDLNDETNYRVLGLSAIAQGLLLRLKEGDKLAQ